MLYVCDIVVFLPFGLESDDQQLPLLNNHAEGPIPLNSPLLIYNREETALFVRWLARMQ